MVYEHTFSWKDSKAKGVKILKRRILQSEKRGNSPDANKLKLRLQRMIKIHGV